MWCDVLVLVEDEIEAKSSGLRAVKTAIGVGCFGWRLVIDKSWL